MKVKIADIEHLDVKGWQSEEGDEYFYLEGDTVHYVTINFPDAAGDGGGISEVIYPLEEFRQLFEIEE